MESVHGWQSKLGKSRKLISPEFPITPTSGYRDRIISYYMIQHNLLHKYGLLQVTIINCCYIKQSYLQLSWPITQAWTKKTRKKLRIQFTQTTRTFVQPSLLEAYHRQYAGRAMALASGSPPIRPNRVGASWLRAQAPTCARAQRVRVRRVPHAFDVCHHSRCPVPASLRPRMSLLANPS